MLNVKNSLNLYQLFTESLLYCSSSQISFSAAHIQTVMKHENQWGFVKPDGFS